MAYMIVETMGGIFMTKRYTSTPLVCLLVLTVAAGSAMAAKKVAPKKAPPKKAPVSTTHHETTGTEQLKGEYGELGHTYTLGKVRPWNINLKSAEYTIDPVFFGDRAVWPKEDEKLLVLHFNVHNPQKGLALMRHDMLRVTAIDSNDKNIEKENFLANEDKRQSIAQEFKPAQKMDVYTVIRVPDDAVIPKLMVTSPSDKLVIRYDLRDKIKGLPASYADPSDPTGRKALSVIPAKMGEYYPSGVFAIKLESVSYSSDPINNRKPGKGQFMVAIMSVKALTQSKPILRHDMFEFKVLDSDGGEIRFANQLLKVSSDSAIAQELDSGQEVRFRLVFAADQGVTAKTFRVAARCQGKGKAYLYTIE